MSPILPSTIDTEKLLQSIRLWARELGFTDMGISSIELGEAESQLRAWLDRGYHGSMSYMKEHGSKRSRPQELIPGTLSVLSLRMDYLPEPQQQAIDVLENSNLAYVSRYALGRDYHKLIRQRLKKLAQRIQEEIGEFSYRVFTDSAPVMEKPIANQAGLGWVGKHSNMLNREAGSWFFLGEIYLSLPLPESRARSNHCGDCVQCIDLCPTRAIVEPYVVDSRLCISYLTIENNGEIPIELRPLMGNRIYGCDDCQLVCPWNRFANLSLEADFRPRENLDASKLTTLFSWSEEQFLKRFEGSPIRRIGYQNWLRNIAVALGNAEKTPENLHALLQRENHPVSRVREHIHWAIEQQQAHA